MTAHNALRPIVKDLDPYGARNEKEVFSPGLSQFLTFSVPNAISVVCERAGSAPLREDSPISGIEAPNVSAVLVA